jgi:hypothetical protein
MNKHTFAKMQRTPKQRKQHYHDEPVNPAEATLRFVGDQLWGGGIHGRKPR